jgi:hypothetical protein
VKDGGGAEGGLAPAVATAPRNQIWILGCWWRAVVAMRSGYKRVSGGGRGPVVDSGGAVRWRHLGCGWPAGSGRG